jgi:hypothetical protein
MRIMKGFACAFDLFEDVGGLGRSDKGFGIFVMPTDVVIDGKD